MLEKELINHRKIMGVESMMKEPFPCAILSVSDSRTLETDEVGKTIKEMLEGNGFHIHYYHIIKKKRDQVRESIWTILKESSVNLLIIQGGSGPGLLDSTPDEAEQFFAKDLKGFGEIFRELFYQEVGSKAMFSRATAGVSKKGVFIFVLPGSVQGARLAMEKLILPEMLQLAGSLTRASG